MIDASLDFFAIKDNFVKTRDVESLEIIKSNLEFNPKVTIAIPTYKRSELLKATIESAIKQQGFNEYDIIVVDNDPERNCITEQLMLTISDNRISYYKNSENIGMTGNWNRLFELAKGEYVVMLHDDDLLYPNYLFILNQLCNKTNYLFDAIYPKYNYLDNNVTYFWPIQKTYRFIKYVKLSFKDFTLSNIIGAPVGILFKKDKVFAIGGFDNDFYPSIDYAFYVKFSYYYRSIKLINNEISIYRIHANESQNESTVLSFIKKDLEIKNHIVENSALKIIKKIFSHYNDVANVNYLSNMANLYRIEELSHTKNLVKSNFVCYIKG